jgi:hypothetical protein
MSIDPIRPWDTGPPREAETRPMIRIDKNIPVPKKARTEMFRNIRYEEIPWKHLRIGDSFNWPARNVPGIEAWAKKHWSMKLHIAEETSEGFRRIWRIE